MTTAYILGLVVGTLAGILGTLSVLAIRRWRPRKLDHDNTLERLRKLQEDDAFQSSIDATEAARRLWQ